MCKYFKKKKILYVPDIYTQLKQLFCINQLSISKHKLHTHLKYAFKLPLATKYVITKQANYCKCRDLKIKVISSYCNKVLASKTHEKNVC